LENFGVKLGRGKKMIEIDQEMKVSYAYRLYMDIYL